MNKSYSVEACQHCLVKILVHRKPSLVACFTKEIYLVGAIASDCSFILGNIGPFIILIDKLGLLFDKSKSFDLGSGLYYSRLNLYVSTAVGLVEDNTFLVYIDDIDCVALT